MKKYQFFFKKSEKCWRKEKKIEKKMLSLSFFPFEEISIQPELSSPTRFRIQGGSPERDGAAGAGQDSSFLLVR